MRLRSSIAPRCSIGTDSSCRSPTSTRTPSAPTSSGSVEPLVEIVHREEHLEERRHSRVSIRLQTFDQQREREILVGPRGVDGGLHALNRFLKLRPASNAGSHDHRVHEVADDLAQTPVSARE